MKLMETQDHCVTDRPTPASGQQPSGEISKIADVDVSEFPSNEITWKQCPEH